MGIKTAKSETALRGQKTPLGSLYLGIFRASNENFDVNAPKFTGGIILVNKS